MPIDTKEKVADWKECDYCQGNPRGCSHCSKANPGYILVPR